MLKRKAFNKVFLTTVIFFIVFALYSFKVITGTFDTGEDAYSGLKEAIFTLNKDGYVSETSVYVGKFFTLEDRIKEKLEVMINENNKNTLLPSYFKPILPQNTKILDVVVDDSLVKVYFSKELNDITDEQSEKMIEAITYTIVDDDNVLGVEIYVDGQMLKYVPHTKKELPTILTRDFGINKIYDVFSNKDVTKVIMNYYTSDSDDYYKVPVTRYLNDSREKLEIIFDGLSFPAFDYRLINFIDGVVMNSYEIKDDLVIVNLDNDIDEKSVDLLIASIFGNYDVEKVDILVNNQKKVEKFKKDIEK